MQHVTCACLSDSTLGANNTNTAVEERGNHKSKADITSLLPPKKKKKSKSEVWDYFGYPKNKYTVLKEGCLVCKNVVAKGNMNIFVQSMCPIYNFNQQ